MKYLVVILVTAFSSVSIAEAGNEFDQFAIESFSKKQKPKSAKFYKKLADKEENITRAAMAILKRQQAGVTVNDDGSFTFTAPVQPTPVQPSKSFSSSQSNIEIGGIEFDSVEVEESNPAFTPSWSLTRITGDKAHLTDGMQNYTMSVGDQLHTGELVRTISLDGVVLSRFGQPDRTLRLNM